uniref:CARD domain-containing protein n=1 Tax=Sparus aurata TaxID=8175 RepID=A0A671Y647_SPAAU
MAEGRCTGIKYIQFSGINFYLLSSDEHFVDKHQSELIKRVSKVEPILDELLRQNVIQQESCEKIKTLSTAEEKMRELISGPLKSSGVQGKDMFYEILIKNQGSNGEYN